MIYVVYENNSGRIVSTQSYKPNVDKLNSYLEIDDNIYCGLYSYVENNKLIPMPEQPSVYHNFNYVSKQWEDTRTREELSKDISNQRNKLLLASDWTQLPDVPLLTQQKWLDYRQQLRDITTQSGYPNNVVWPTPPQ